MTTSSAAPALHDSSSPLNAFTGAIGRTRTGPLYIAGLAVVAFAMILLPLIYIALIALVAWGVVLHMRYDTWIFEGATGRAGLLRVGLYLAPAVIGAILVFFMVKPFFAAKTKTPDPITLDPEKEPLLFSFVQRICALVGAPAPCRIDVDCQVNASASLRRGLWSRDLVLTIGLPLAAGLDMRQFAGVLAHEFGHFAQGAGMRLTYVIRKISFWFARVVYERDQWDVGLEKNARTSDWRIAAVLQAARATVWLTRRVLWVLMYAGQAISCFMLRQMEFDADSYEAKVAGSDAFESTAVQLRLLNAATEGAYADVRQSWASQRLPDNLAVLIDQKAATLPADLQEKLFTSTAKQKTGWLDTHPCDADRIRAARRLSQPGVFHLEERAMHLFTDFNELGRAVTRHQYEKHFELTFTDQNLIPAEEILRESAATAEADAMVQKYYGQVNVTLSPLCKDAELPTIAPSEALRRWREARRATEALREEAERISAECLQNQRRIADLTIACHLSSANFVVPPTDFGLPDGATTPGEQEAAARSALDERAAKAAALLSKLEAFIFALRERITVALGSVNSYERAEVEVLVKLLAAVGAELPHVHHIAMKLRSFGALAQNGSADPELTRDLQNTIAGLQARLATFAYPFPHARGQLSVADYARATGEASNDLHRTYLDAASHVEKLFALNYRLIGKVLAYADAAEQAMG